MYLMVPVIALFRSFSTARYHTNLRQINRCMLTAADAVKEGAGLQKKLTPFLVHFFCFLPLMNSSEWEGGTAQIRLLLSRHSFSSDIDMMQGIMAFNGAELALQVSPAYGLTRFTP